METIPPEQIKTEVADKLYKEHEVTEGMIICPVELQGGSVESSGSHNSKMANSRDCASYETTKQKPEEVIVKSEQEEAVSSVEMELSALYEGHEVKEEMVIGPVVLQKDAPVQSYPNMDTCKTSDRNFHDVTATSAHTHKPEHDLNNVVPDIRYPFICDYCNKKCKRKGVLVNHIRVHTREYPYKCIICEETFHYRDDLNHHLKNHIGENGHVCEVCSRTFSLLCDFKAHQWEHKNIKDKRVFCEICQKQLHRTSMSDHYKTHTGEKPYKCDKCDKRFYNAKGLRYHRKARHAHEFTCDVCDKQFYNEKYWKYHVCSKARYVTSSTVKHLFW